MHVPTLDSWPATTSAAIAMQVALRGAVATRDALEAPRCVAGVDVGFEDAGTVARAAVAVLTLPDLILMDWSVAREPTRFPYIPGLLSFREIPVVLRALQGLQVEPDLILCDGQGRAHPRRFGIACHLGVLTDIPCIGVAKSRLIGTYHDLDDRKGARAELMDRGEQVGTVLRSRQGVAPIFVSIGHRVSLPTAVDLTESCIGRFRLPETTRWAHFLASDLRQG